MYVTENMEVIEHTFAMPTDITFVVRINLKNEYATAKDLVSEKLRSN